MILPYGTDAPVYHFPWATIGVMAVTFVVSALFIQDGFGAQGDDLVLIWGDGLHPTQWITANFIHADVWHLLGNLLFLWVFGLVVEGKIGWRRFLAVYFGIGIAECAIEQTAMLWADGGGSLGNSSILFGLMAMALVWAPANDVRLYYWIAFRMGLAAVKIRTFAVLYVLFDLLEMGLALGVGQGLGSAFLHLLGAGIGFPIAVLMLKKGWVDCEGWDLFSRWPGRRREVELHRKRSSDPEAPAGAGASGSAGIETPPPAARDEALSLLRGYLAEGDAAMAKATYDQTVAETGPWPLPEADLLAWIQLHKKLGTLDGAKLLLKEAIERIPAKAAALKVLLASVYIENESRPARGLEVLASIPRPSLTEHVRTAIARLRRKAEELQRQGAMELDVDD